MVLRRGPLESGLLNHSFWRSKRVFLTGHTGFKGSWLSLWLNRLGAQVTGLGLAPEPGPSLFEQAGVGVAVDSVMGDVRDPDVVNEAIARAEPEVVFHMAAQSLVRRSYIDPVTTYETNVLGTAHLLEAVRGIDNIRVVVVTSDKCYENVGTLRPYREDDPLGGRDPYSSSKACAEHLTASYRNSFFGGRCLATARAGNVIGGCDWAEDRLIPDLARAAMERRPAVLRNPDSVRPWQHVLDCLSGYLTLAEALEGSETASAWNFGPEPDGTRSVGWMADAFAEHWPGGVEWTTQPDEFLSEARLLQLDSSKARSRLGWQPRLTLEEAVAWTVRVYEVSNDEQQLRQVIEKQLDHYMSSAEGRA